MCIPFSCLHNCAFAFDFKIELRVQTGFTFAFDLEIQFCLLPFACCPLPVAFWLSSAKPSHVIKAASKALMLGMASCQLQLFLILEI